MATVVYGTTRLGLLVDGTKELPLGRAHFGARCRRTRRGVEEEPYDQGVALGYQKATELVEPERTIRVGRRASYENRSGARHGLRVASAMVVVKSSQMLLELESRVELGREARHGQHGETGRASLREMSYSPYPEGQ